MFNSGILDVGIGLTLVFLFASIVATALQEALEGLLRMRSRDLRGGIASLLGAMRSDGTVDPAHPLLAQFYSLPHIASLSKGDYKSATWRNLPSYIPAASFSSAVIDLVKSSGGVAGPLSLAALRETASKIPSERLRTVFTAALDDAGQDVAALRANLEDWFNGSMDRVSGWYKRRTQGILLCIGLAGAILFNIDPLTIGDKLWHNEALRGAFVEYAGSLNSVEAAANGADAAAVPTLAAMRDQLNAIEAPIGWSPAPQGDKWTVWTWVFAVFGWAITALATMLGAPFWFDILNKFMVIRSTVKPHEKSREEGSEDRADKTAHTLQLVTQPAPEPK